MDEAEHNVNEASSSNDSNNNNSAPSADDLAWADSCLFKLTEASDSDWSSFKDSLLEILNTPTEPVSLMATDSGNNDHIELGDDHTFSSGQSVEAAFSMMADDHSGFTDEDEGRVQDEDDAIDVGIGRKKKEWLKRKKLMEDALLPDHAEFAKVEISDLGFDLESLSFEPETSFSDAIFKVWDLGISDEQDEFTNALNTALEESKLDETLDHVIAGISGLALDQSSK